MIFTPFVKQRMTTTSQYNFCIDFFKGIACMMVIFIHCRFPGFIGQAIQAIARFAVPFFFMVSGYYCFSPRQRSFFVGGRKIFHVFIITILSYLFYFGLTLLDKYVICASISLDYSLSDVWNFIIFNQPINVPGHLWFLFALLYVYLLNTLIDIFNIRRFAYAWAGIMFLALVFLNQVIWYIWSYEIPSYFYRNGLIEGFAFFMLGYYLRKRQGKLSIDNISLWFIILCSVVLNIAEHFLCEKIFNIYICTYPLVTGMFIYATKNSSSFAGIIQRIGNKYSVYIYVLHIFVWDYLVRFLHVVGCEGNNEIMYFIPLAVLIITLLLSAGCYTIIGEIRKLRIKISQ